MLELSIAAFLILLNGVFALSELSVVSARRPRLRIMAEQGRAGARAALRLAEHPGRFLSTVQIGITLVGVLAGAFSGAALGKKLSDWIETFGVKHDVADISGFVIVVTAITFLSVIIGELVPKHLALKNPERIACMMAPSMLLLSKIASPVVTLLDATTRAFLIALGITSESESAVTDEEIRTIVAEAESAGVIESEEQSMISGVMRLGDRSVRAIMTPRTEVELINLADDDEDIRKALIKAHHAVVPVCNGAPDTIVGVVRVRDIVAPLATRGTFAIKPLVIKAPVIPDTTDALAALKTLREAEVPYGLVHDEFGHFEGVLTPADILDAIAGAFKADEGDEPEAVKRDDGSWLIAGWMPVDEMADLLYLNLPAKRGYDTVAGFVLDAFKRLPDVGDRIDILGWRFEIMDLDGRRIDKVLAARVE
ncbi:MAG: HlyC/CorC family transporter [Phyllobacteriaceae bacterium]|nr:HlyC/CorC family transporter [Phyllobacteriaceae bacterium]